MKIPGTKSCQIFLRKNFAGPKRSRKLSSLEIARPPKAVMRFQGLNPGDSTNLSGKKISAHTAESGTFREIWGFSPRRFINLKQLKRNTY